MLAAVLAGVVVACSLAQPEAATASDRKRPSGEPSPAAASARPVPSLGERAAGIAVRAVGIPYRYGGESPASGFDCSGLVRWAYGRLGVDLPHSSYALAVTGRRVASERLRPGDVLLFDGLGHVGLYLGRGRMVHAPQSGRTVEVVALRSTAYGGRLLGARRIVPA